MFCIRAVLSLLTAMLLWVYGCVDAKETVPLKIIAPDLIVQSLEFGKFPLGHGPLDEGVQPEHYQFVPVPNRIASDDRCGYGFRLKLHTTRKQLRIYQTFNTPRPLVPKKGDGYDVTPFNGNIYREWPSDGLKNGKYWVQVWVEDIPLPKLSYQLRY